MEANDKAAIDGLFERLDQAERAAGPRDAQAETYIRDRIARQPAAPYYLAQAVLVQQHGLETLTARVEELERELAQRPAAGGGFLGGLFGAPKPAQDQRRLSYPPPSQQMQAFRQAPPGSFLGGAMQTAMGVAGGLLLGNALASLFGGGNEAQAAEPEPAAMDDGSGDDGGFDLGGFGDEEW